MTSNGYVCTGSVIVPQNDENEVMTELPGGMHGSLHSEGHRGLPRMSEVPGGNHGTPHNEGHRGLPRMSEVPGGMHGSPHSEGKRGLPRTEIAHGSPLSEGQRDTANKSLLWEMDNDRRSTLKDVRYGTTSSYMSEHQSGTVFIRVSVPELKVQKCLQFELDETVWDAKQRILAVFSKDLKDPLNYGIYMPPMNGRAGKFLDEERLLREYPLHGPIGFVEFKYKRRVYKVIHLNPRKLKQLHNKSNFRQFMEHVKNGNLSKIHKLTNKGLDPNFQDSAGETPLSYAILLPKEKCREVIISLVSGGAHLDFRTRQGQTPIHKAVLAGNQGALKALLDLGASANYKDSRGLTPLYYSVLYGKNAACAEMLLHERAAIGTQDEQGWFEIHQACKLGLVQHLEHLMFYGADLNVQNASGNTPLHVCAVNNNEQCARVLLFRGADKHVPNFNNQTAQQVAVLAGNISLAEVIKNFEESQVVPFREMPTFSERRPRLSMYGSTLSLVSRSRSDPKLNLSMAADDSNFTSPISSVRSLPQRFTMYSDSGSYPASRGSDSPRSMSLSSTSSGPGTEITNSRSPSEYSLRTGHRLSSSHRSNTFAGRHHYQHSMNGETFEELTRGGNFYIGTPSSVRSHKEHVTFSLLPDALWESDDNLPETSQHLLWDQGSALQQSKEGVYILEKDMQDRQYICTKAYTPQHPEELTLHVGDIVEVVSMSDTGYWEGIVDDNEGWFPASHVRLRNKASSVGDLLGEESRENTLLYRNTLARLVHSDNSDYGPRTVVLQRASEGYGFVLRGAKSQLKPSGELDFRPTPEFPALQYLDSVDPGSVSDRAGLKAGDFILEINGENVVRASHDRVVHLIRSTGDTLAMKVVTVRPAHRSQDWFIQADKSMTMPNRKKQAPAPPQRDPRTSLSMSRSEGLNISEEMAVMEKLDQAILGKKEEEKKTASIRNRTAAKRVSCVDINDIGAESKLERSKSTPDLLDSDSKQKRNIIYASPTVPGQKSSDERTVSSESGGVSLYARPSGPPPLPPQETASPKKKAPKPPGSDSGESTTQMVTINKQSPYASSKILVKADSTDSAYESSFRPGASAKLSEEPNEKSGYKPSHQRVSSEGAVIIRAGDQDSNKQNVSFAEDKVLDHAASFLKKHPNAKLLITAQGKESLRRRSSKRHPQEPEPDYDSDSGGDKPPSPVKMRDPKHQSVTVITVGDKRETQQQTQAKRYTIHSSIPSEEFVIPPRPEGPAPTPPKNTAVAKTQQSPTPSHSRVLTVHAEVNTIHKHTHVEDHAPPLPETSPPRLEPVTAAPPPVAPAPPPPPPPPPPAPSVEEITRSKSVVKADYIAPVSVPADAIAAAVAKRQERLQNQGPKISTQTPKSPAPVMDTNQAAILAAVARRREQLEQQSTHSVVETIESRLQKTKKLQAAKFSLAGSKPVKKDVDVKADEKINSVSEKLAEAKIDIVKPSVPGTKVTENPSKQENGVKAKELNFTVKSGNDHKKPVGGNEMRPKSPNTNKEFTVHKGAKLDRKESLQIKPLPLEPTVGHATMSNEQSGDSKPKAHHTDHTNIQKNTEQENNKKNLNGQSDFLALAEKRRQEWLQRKQKTSDSKSSSNTASPEHILAKDKMPSVATKPKTSNIKSQGNSTASMNGNINNNHIPHAPPPPPGFRDDTNMGGKQVQLEIIPPPANFSMDSGMDSSNQHSPAFSPDTASLVSSLSTLSSLSGDQNDGRGNGYDDVLAPPPPGFEDGDIPVIPPPPEFGNQHDSVTQWKNSKTFADKPVGQWLCNDVLDWLDSLSMSQYKSSFQRNCIDGKKLLALTRNNYIELGVTQVGHRMNIERSIKKAAIKQNNESNDVIASEHL